MLELSGDLFDSFYDFDYTQVRDTDTHSRGGHLYFRPCGWKRFALRVKDKYMNERWLEMEDGRGVWLNSYHGTKSEALVDLMLTHGFTHKKSKDNYLQSGIYSTPYIELAEKYATTFFHNGKAYLVVLQNRINPKRNKMVNNNLFYLAKDPQDIRPFGVCIREKKPSFIIEIVSPEKEKVNLLVESNLSIRSLKVLYFFENRKMPLSSLIFQHKGKNVSEHSTLKELGIEEDFSLNVKSSLDSVADEMEVSLLMDIPKLPQPDVHQTVLESPLNI